MHKQVWLHKQKTSCLQQLSDINDRQTDRMHLLRNVCMESIGTPVVLTWVGVKEYTRHAQETVNYKPEQREALLAAQDQLFMRMHEVLEKREAIVNTLQTNFPCAETEHKNAPLYVQVSARAYSSLQPARMLRQHGLLCCLMASSLVSGVAGLHGAGSGWRPITEPAWQRSTASCGTLLWLCLWLYPGPCGGWRHGACVNSMLTHAGPVIPPPPCRPARRRTI